jgi:tetratricopeptide (TPR) repeat protein
MVTRKAATPVAIVLAALVLNGCLQGAINENKQQLEQQQSELSQLQQQVSALQTQRANASYSAAPPAPGSCDPAVMNEATHKGGARMAAGEVDKALGYYQDAVSACPTSGEAQLNLANTYESIGDRAEAIAHYRLAASASRSAGGTGTAQKARAALSRLGASS